MKRKPNTADIVGAFIASRALLAPATVKWYGYILRDWFAFAPDHPSAAHIDNWLATAPSPETARNWLRAVRACYNWAERRGLIDRSPARLVTTPSRPRRLPRVFTPTELHAIFAIARRDPRDLAAVTVLLDTGVRIGELASLRTEDIELVLSADGTPNFRITIIGKTGQRRTALSPGAYKTVIPIAPPAGHIFRSWPGRCLAPGRATRPMAVATLQDRVRRVIQRAGTTGSKVGPHTFRHTFATEYLRAGGDLYRLQRLLGHSSIRQTTAYLALADEDAFVDHTRLSPLRIVS